MIKGFNEYITESNSEYYTKITPEQYREYINKLQVRIDYKMVKDYIEDIINKEIDKVFTVAYRRIKVEYTHEYDRKFDQEFDQDKLVINFTFGRLSNLVDITQLEDEYYLLRFNRPQYPIEDYKCDQIDGLIECLKYVIKNLFF